MAMIVLLLSLVLLILPSPSTTDTGPQQDDTSNAKPNSTALAIRLVNGSRCAGRVEILYNGKWGTVCNDFWDMNDTQVVCRQVGCGRPISFHGADNFGPGSGPIVLDDVRCAGIETYLWNCTHRGLSRHNCDHSEDVGVTCTDERNIIDAPDTSTAMSTEGPITRDPERLESATPEISAEMSTEGPITRGPQRLESTTSDTSTAMSPEEPTTTGPSSTTPDTIQETTSAPPDTSTAMSPEEPTTTGPSSTTPDTIQGTTSAPPENFPDNSLRENNESYTREETLTASYGRFASPLYPSYYPQNALCIWTIVSAAPNTFIVLNFPSMDLESDENCTRDFVIIYDGPRGSPIIGRICQPTQHTFSSKSNVLTVVLQTDGFMQSTGFEAYYYTSTATDSMSENCGDILIGLQGAFHSSRTASPDSDECIWHIVVGDNYKIHLQFEIFEMKHNHSCHSFSLSVYDGTPQGSLILGQLCGTSDRLFISSTNSITVVYTKLNDDTDLGLEFSASYYTVFQSNTHVTLSCHPDCMEVRVSKTYMESMGCHSHDMFLNDPMCRPENQTDCWMFRIPYQSCLTHSQAHNDTISYENTLSTYSMKPMVTRTGKFNFTLKCVMHQDTKVDSSYFANDIMETSVMQYGLFLANLTFFKSENFEQPVAHYPYFVNLNQDLYVQATLYTTDNTLVFFAHTCVASPYPFDMSGSGTVYYLIRDGCPRVSDYKTYYSPSQSSVRFGFKAFSFSSPWSKVYILCKFVVCKQNDERSRCKQGCKRRHKRAVEAHEEHVHVVAGPVKLLNY